MRQVSTLVKVIVCIFCSIIFYLFLSHLFISPKITIPISIIIPILIFGLIRYYSSSIHGHESEFDTSVSALHKGSSKEKDDVLINKQGYVNNFIFISFYFSVLIICEFSKLNFHIFLDWNEIGISGFVQLAAAIALNCFIPGYAIVQIIFKKTTLLLKVLLGYLLSLLIIGGAEYISAMYLDYPSSEARYLISGVHFLILIGFTIYSLKITKFPEYRYYKTNRHISYFKSTFWSSLKYHYSEVLVFGSLLALLIVSTSYLFGGTTIGDQWFHQGRAILFISGSIHETALSHADPSYAPFQSAILAALTSYSGLPLVNTYASIAFLNIVPVFGYYYFFSSWIKTNGGRAKLLAAVLFATSSGFSWIYVLDLMATTQQELTQRSVFDILTSMEPFDTFQPTNFLFASHPDFSSGLIYIALPAGLVLLGILREKINKYKLLFLVTSISILGILTHYEFHLFIIVASIIPLIYRIKSSNQMYAGFMLAFMMVFLIDVLNPQDYYVSHQIGGISLLYLNALFTGGTWALHFVKRKMVIMLETVLVKLRQIATNRAWHTMGVNDKRHFLTSVIIISVVCYLYGLSFIVLAHLPTETIINQTQGFGQPYSVPWYLYPMKFGVVGLFALVSILSYLFKVDDRRVWIFAVIGVVALFLGPYYDEHRFSKYILVGLVGFASPIIYRILNILKGSDRLATSNTLIAGIIIVSILSSLVYIGYNSLILQTQEYDHSLLSRRNFPTSDMSLFQTINDMIDFGSNRYNILTFPKEYDRDRGLMTAFQAFSGLPETKVYEKPLTLNVSTLYAFYHLLDKGQVRYIVIPKPSINETIRLTDPVRFAMAHFKHIFENTRYVVLEVPEMTPPSSTSASDIAFVSGQNEPDGISSSDILDLKLLKYDNKTFDFAGQTNFVILQSANNTEKAILAGQSNRGITLWSRNISSSSGLNYFKVLFTIREEQEGARDLVGLRWKEAMNDYLLSLSGDGIELTKRFANSGTDQKLTYQNPYTKMKKLILYDLQVLSTQNSIKIFVNGTLQISFPHDPSESNGQGISGIGISASKGIVQFGQIQTGNIPEDRYEHSKNYDYGYPLSLLALSKFNYDVFLDQDFSSFSKKTIVLGNDLNSDNVLYDNYLEHAKRGGSIVVMNSNNFEGTFSQLFGIKYSGTESEFTRIITQADDSMSISGSVNKVQFSLTNDSSIISTYRDNSNQIVAPFVLQKSYPGGGKIVLVNAKGYFDSLSRLPSKYFSSLSKMAFLFDVVSSKPSDSANSELAKHFIDDLTLKGNSTLITSSLLLSNSANDLRDSHVNNIIVSDKAGKLKHTYRNVTLTDIKIIGDYELSINSSGNISLPYYGSANQYISIAMPSNFNMSLNLISNTSGFAVFKSPDQPDYQTIKFGDKSAIEFNQITNSVPLSPVILTLKSPDIIASGHIKFAQYFDPDLSGTEMKLETDGKIQMKLALTGYYEQPYNDSTTVLKYVTFPESVLLDRTSSDEDISFELPGDISEHSKSLGLVVPLKTALLSISNFILLGSIILVSTTISWISWNKRKNQAQFTRR